MTINPLAASAVFKGVEYLSNAFKKGGEEKEQQDPQPGLLSSLAISPQAMMVKNSILDISQQMREKYGSKLVDESEQYGPLFEFVSQQLKSRFGEQGVDLEANEITNAIKDNLTRLENGELKSFEFVSALKIELGKIIS